MSIRSEIESRLGAFAASQNPPIPIAFENKKFTKPTSGFYFEVVLLDSVTVNTEISAGSKRITGRFMINCYGELGVGMGAIEALADKVINLYPVIPKTGIVSIERPLDVGQGIVVENFICIPITGDYRAEL